MMMIEFWFRFILSICILLYPFWFLVINLFEGHNNFKYNPFKPNSYAD